MNELELKKYPRTPHLEGSRLQPGDEVILTNLWETLRYQVTGIEIIAPNDVEAIHIREGKDMLTLLTCHPYASGGRYRYLVLCERSVEP